MGIYAGDKMNQNLLVLMQKDFLRIDFNNTVYNCNIGWDHLVYETFKEIDKVLSITSNDTLEIIKITHLNAWLDIKADLENCSLKSSQEIGKIIARAKVQSSHICELCGKSNGVVPYYDGVTFQNRCEDCLPTEIEEEEI